MWNILFLLTLFRVVSTAFVANSISQSSDNQRSSTTSVVNSNAAASSYSSEGSISTLTRGPPCYDDSVDLVASSVVPCGRFISATAPVAVDRPAVRFGFDVPPPPGPYHTPNCGCVSRGGCSGEVGVYTRQVIHRSDLVCGLRFETCCYDGPFPGVVDEFSRAAACIPQEQCVRPYGILSTDVRDFGVIAPCPGYGAVRCLIVDSQGLLEFKAALASIEASSHQRIIQTDTAQVAPIHIDVPVMQAAVNTGVSSFASGSALIPVNPPTSVLNNAVTTGTYASSVGPFPGSYISSAVSSSVGSAPIPVARPEGFYGTPIRVVQHGYGNEASAVAHASAVAVPVTLFVPEPEPAPVPVPVPTSFVRPPGFFGFPGYGGV